jgi:hypothetical protein
MPYPSIALRLTAAEQQLNAFATSRGASEQGIALAAAIRQLLEAVRLLATQYADQARTLNRLTGRVEALERGDPQ